MAVAKRNSEPTVLTTVNGVRCLLAKLLAGRVDRDGLRKFAGELKWPHATLHKRIHEPKSMTIAEVDELVSRFRIKLWMNVL